MSPPLPDAICNKCNAPATLMCQRCAETYCTADCQILDWREHKSKCYRMPNLVPIKRALRSHATPLNESLQTQQQMRRPHSASSTHIDILTRSSNNISGGGGPPKPELPLLEDKDFRLRPKVVPKPPAWSNHFVPPTNVFFEAVVQFVEELDPTVVWVSELKYATAMCKLLKEIQRSIGRELASSPPKHLRIGALVAAPLNEIFYRAEVVELSADSPQHAATVRLIDYGNEICLPLSKLHPPIPIMGNLNAYAFRIRLPADCCVPLELESLLTLRLLSSAKTPDGLYRVEVKPKSVPLALPVEELSQNPTVVPLKVLPGGRHALLQLPVAPQTTAAADDHNNNNISSSHNNNDLNAYLNTEQGLKFDFDTAAAALPGEGAFVAARTDARGWRRACLLAYAAAQHCYLVYLIDDGQMCLCSQVKRIPAVFAERPMRVFVISATANAVSELDAQLANCIAAGKTLALQFNPLVDSKQPSALPCTLYEDSKKLADVLAACFTGLLKELSLQFWPEAIADGSSVYITRVISHADVFITASCCKQYAKLFAALATECGAYAPPLPQDDPLPVAGHLVLVNVVGTSEFFRAEITSRSGGGASTSFNVINIDTGANWDDIPLKLLRKPNRFVRCCPVYLQRVKLMYIESIPNPLPGNKALASLLQFQGNAIEFDVKFDAHRKDVVDLLFRTKEQQSLSKKLLPQLFEKCATGVVAPGNACDKPKNSSNVVKAKKCAAALPLLPTGASNLAEDTPLPPSPPDTPVALEPPTPLQIEEKQMPSSKEMIAPLYLGIPNLNIKEITEKASAKIYTLADLDVVPITVADNVPIFILDSSLIYEGFVTASDFSSKSFVTEMERSLATVSKYCKCPHIVKGYMPRAEEICLAVYSVDGEWYRAVCLDEPKNEQETFRVMFLDYGNICKVSKSEVLPINKDLMFPSNANMCYIEGLTTKRKADAFAKAVFANPIITCNVAKHDVVAAYTLQVQNLEKLIA